MVTSWKRLFYLARSRKESPEAYRALQHFQGAATLNRLEAWRIQVAGQRALDLGCGYGGFSLALVDRGARVTAMDISLRFLRNLPPDVRPVCADALHLPFQDESFDLMLCVSLIEHVPDPQRLVAEIRRVLRPGSFCLLSFPPFYSPRGGHQFAPYHLLGERFATWVYRRALAKRMPEWQSGFLGDGKSYRLAYKGFGLYRVTIGSAKKIVKESGLETVRMSTRLSKINPASWPVIGEFLTWHVEFLLRKPP